MGPLAAPATCFDLLHPQRGDSCRSPGLRFPNSIVAVWGLGGAELSHLEGPSAFGLSLHKQETEAQKATVLYSKQTSVPLGQGQTPNHGPQHP